MFAGKDKINNERPDELSEFVLYLGKHCAKVQYVKVCLPAESDGLREGETSYCYEKFWISP